MPRRGQWGPQTTSGDLDWVFLRESLSLSLSLSRVRELGWVWGLGESVGSKWERKVWRGLGGWWDRGPSWAPPNGMVKKIL